jgi:ADP-ribose pyrophosphatase YjhB (NUDIX family)
VWLAQPRFTVTVGAVLVDVETGRVLLLKHVFRGGSGWGIPGGFINKGEQPEEAVRRELREEVGLEFDRAELALVRTLKRPRQVEVIFRCTVRASRVRPGQSFEVAASGWFATDALPDGLPEDQRRLISRALSAGSAPPGE